MQCTQQEEQVCPHGELVSRLSLTILLLGWDTPFKTMLLYASPREQVELQVSFKEEEQDDTISTNLFPGTRGKLISNISERRLCPFLFPVCSVCSLLYLFIKCTIHMSHITQICRQPLHSLDCADRVQSIQMGTPSLFCCRLLVDIFSRWTSPCFMTKSVW